MATAPNFESEVLPGTFRVTASALPQGFSVRSLTAGNVDLTREALTVSPGDAISVAATLGAATPSPFFRVAGRVSGAPGARQPSWIRLTGSATTAAVTAAVNADGSFEFAKVLPGEYEARVLPSAIYLTKTLIVGNADVRDVVIAAPAIQEFVGQFVKVEPGEFTMGCSPEDAQCEAIESPRHRVGITRPFEIGKYEVTQAQWEAVMGTNPSQFKGRDRPVEGLTTWQDTQEFIERLNMLNDGYRYRLPTEAEWEYAARAGTTTPFPGDLNAISWNSGNAENQTHPVGQKQPNAWGIHDMIGNVLEWVQDFSSATYYAESPALDPTGPALGSDHVVRGGAWSHIPQWSRVSFRRNLVNRGSYGLRLAREVIPK
jgi:formylglycine-generating enzyme required for sulfatase activity